MFDQKFVLLLLIQLTFNDTERSHRMNAVVFPIIQSLLWSSFPNHSGDAASLAGINTLTLLPST